METRDQWYKPNLLYNIHWRPPETQEQPKMIVKTVRFNPSVCTCGEHNCGPHYRMERKVVWINKETTNTTENKVKDESDSWKGLQNDREVKSRIGEVLHSSEERVSDFKCKSNTNYNERCTEEEIYNREITKECFGVSYDKRLEKDDNRKYEHGKEEKVSDFKCKSITNDKERCTEEEKYNREITKECFSAGYSKRLEKEANRKYDKSKDSSETDGQMNIGSKSVGGADEFNMKEWLAKRKEDSCDGYQKDDSDNDRKRKVGGNNSVGDIDVLKNMRDDFSMYNDYLRTNENLKDEDGYFIRTDESMHTENDKECSDGDFRNRVINGGDNCSVNGKIKMTDVILVRYNNEKVGEKVGKNFKWDCERNNGQSNCNLSTEGIVGNDERCHDSEAGDKERCIINSSDYNNHHGCDEDDTEKIYLDEEISPAFGIMSIYCNSELHLVLGLGA